MALPLPQVTMLWSTVTAAHGHGLPQGDIPMAMMTEPSPPSTAFYNALDPSRVAAEAGGGRGQHEATSTVKRLTHETLMSGRGRTVQCVQGVPSDPILHFVYFVMLPK